MPQLTIYLDKDSERAVVNAARRESVSRSKWARKVLIEAAEKGQHWPAEYSFVLGSVSDETFQPPDDPPETSDQHADFGK
ncbi:MAG: toxin-antitoxin system, antitoxin component [Verrucomicrobia bacterium]|nr:toxin-antitoxin system, antitoxin component [Verrucomicrobiota bacterium]MCH8513412.1 toxin-antitoxin system, antitoxin component [Kiritimatiellia bacterium]